ncbi:hypothetical protein [Comamonas guangdongensis]|uniref:Uncharacterized protein n=1 Tax=Comamonas guangdongensis TaxID=510515 RepID=A0ABV4A2E4_9BURK
MGIEYKIRFSVPEGYSTDRLLCKLPAQQSTPGQMPAYDFALESDGFYFIDHLGQAAVAAQALRALIDEALGFGEVVQISEL